MHVLKQEELTEGASQLGREGKASMLWAEAALAGGMEVKPHDVALLAGGAQKDAAGHLCSSALQF